MDHLDCQRKCRAKLQTLSHNLRLQEDVPQHLEWTVFGET